MHNELRLNPSRIQRNSSSQFQNDHIMTTIPTVKNEWKQQIFCYNDLIGQFVQDFRFEILKLKCFQDKNSKSAASSQWFVA